MEKNILREEITVLIDSIKEHSDKITHYERINQLELELILSKIKKLYEKSIVFNYLNDSDRLKANSNVNKQIDTNQHDSIKVLISEHNGKLIDTTMETKSANPVKIEETETELYSESKEETLHNQKLIDEALEIASEKTAPLENSSPETETNQKPTETITPQINPEPARPANRASISNSIDRKPLEAIIKSIGINERFVLIKELFKNDTNKFNEVLNKINELNSFEEADDYLRNNTAVAYNWNYKSVAVLSFMKLVEKRFI